MSKTSTALDQCESTKGFFKVVGSCIRGKDGELECHLRPIDNVKVDFENIDPLNDQEVPEVSTDSPGTTEQPLDERPACEGQDTQTSEE